MTKRFLMTMAASMAMAMGPAMLLAESDQSGQSQQQTDQSGMSGQAQQAGSEMSGQEGMSDAVSQNPDRAFAAVVVSHARLQKQISELVAQKATNPQIKQLAQDTSTELQQISQKVQDAAKQEGITLHPDRLLPRDQAVLNFMQQLPTSALERNYVFFSAGANQTHQYMAQWAANNAQNPQIKQAAQELSSKLQQRGQTIQQLAQAEVSGGGQAQPAGGYMQPGQGGQSGQQPQGGQSGQDSGQGR